MPDNAHNLLEEFRALSHLAFVLICMLAGILGLACHFQSTVFFLIGGFCYVLFSYFFYMDLLRTGYILRANSWTQCFWSLFGLLGGLFCTSLIMGFAMLIVELDNMSSFQVWWRSRFYRLLLGYTFEEVQKEHLKSKEPQEKEGEGCRHGQTDKR
ncbi:MAG TPA: hypothetical protein PKH31_16520 [Candidatus Sumerlaeota bacterium]|nr:hypothetical protein [Candidatus Sumerlaeota bacterium]